MEPKKFITQENVRLAVAIAGIMVPVFSCYLAIQIGMSEIRGNVALIKQEMASVAKSVDDLCSKYEAQDGRINNLSTAVASLEAITK